MNVKLVSSTQGQGEFEGKSVEEMIVYAARVSSSRKDKFDNPAGLLKYCIDNKHWSIFETGSITMEIKTSKAIGIQLLRHRSFTFQEFSQRYASVNSIEPIEFRIQAEKNRQSSTMTLGTVDVNSPFGEGVTLDQGTQYQIDNIQKATNLLRESKKLYDDMIESGIARECARMILPMATSTTIYMTGSIRSWIHMIDIRDDSHAQKEAQEIAREMKRIFIEQCPIISEALGWIKPEITEVLEQRV